MIPRNRSFILHGDLIRYQSLWKHKPKRCHRGTPVKENPRGSLQYQVPWAGGIASPIILTNMKISKGYKGLESGFRNHEPTVNNPFEMLFMFER